MLGHAAGMLCQTYTPMSAKIAKEKTAFLMIIGMEFVQGYHFLSNFDPVLLYLVDILKALLSAADIRH